MEDIPLMTTEGEYDYGGADTSVTTSSRVSREMWMTSMHSAGRDDS